MDNMIYYASQIVLIGFIITVIYYIFKIFVYIWMGDKV